MSESIWLLIDIFSLSLFPFSLSLKLGHNTGKTVRFQSLMSTICWNIHHDFFYLGNGMDDMSINDLYESKSRKSSGFSDGEKSRNCSGNSISQVNDSDVVHGLKGPNFRKSLEFKTKLIIYIWRLPKGLVPRNVFELILVTNTVFPVQWPQLYL